MQNSTATRLKTGFTLLVLLFWHSTTKAQEKPALPQLDLHVHLSDNLSIEKAVLLSQNKGVTFGIVEHPGICEYCPIQNDSLLLAYINMLRPFPVFVGIQPVVPGWRDLFSGDVLAQLDYIIMDALEIPQPDGSIWRIWMDDTKVDDTNVFMEMYVDYHLRILANEKIDILANATFLPKCLEKDYAIAWTTARMQKVIDAAVKNHVAFEINSYYKVPNREFIQLAKAAGARFSLGTNSRDSFAGTLDYAAEMARECGLTGVDFFVPVEKK